MEHLHHFDLSQDPFQNEPDLRFYFASAYHRDVQLRLDRGLRQRKGLCVLTGEGGTGKTLLARRILDTLEEEVFDANLMVMLAGAAAALGGGAHLVPGAIEPEEVAQAVVEGLAREDFLILPHPEVQQYVQRKASDHGRWIGGMRRLRDRLYRPKS